ncbi:TauD/TfdA family dioxygenase [Streptomyces sp. NPDC056670]|uniref:TauD/TfdA family dioxygenase n=1 Tax=Streptomyces sp. NPDC056670 TaxID=3345904 RepID=UPI0036ADF20F
MKGTYRESPASPHVTLRRALLGARRTHPAPPFPPLRGRAADPVATAEAVLREQLAPHGVAVADLDRPMTNAELVEFGSVLGVPQPERAPDVAARVEDGVVLHLVSAPTATHDPKGQPFAANELSLHTESSGVPVSAQPRYIALMCLSPGGDGRTAQTVVVPMSGVHDSLSPQARDILTRLRYDRPGPLPAVLRRVDGRPVFAIRDFMDTPMPWTLDGPTGRTDAVDDALRELYAAMYGAPSSGFAWTRGRLVVIDNSVHFHGRTRAAGIAGTSARHLKRLRIATGNGR